MSGNEVVILSATRTAIGTLSGGLSSLSAHELGGVVIAEALKKAGVAADQVSEVIMGQILTAGEGSMLTDEIRSGKWSLSSLSPSMDRHGNMLNFFQ